MKFYWAPGVIQDGMLDDSCGRIVLYDGGIVIGYSRGADHNYLLRSLASRYQFPVNDVIHSAVRLYFKYEPEGILLSGVRGVDNEAFESQKRYYANLIKRNFR